MWVGEIGHGGERAWWLRVRTAHASTVTEVPRVGNMHVSTAT